MLCGFILVVIGIYQLIGNPTGTSAEYPLYAVGLILLDHQHPVGSVYNYEVLFDWPIKASQNRFGSSDQLITQS